MALVLKQLAGSIRTAIAIARLFALAKLHFLLALFITVIIRMVFSRAHSSAKLLLLNKRLVSHTQCQGVAEYHMLFF